MTHYETLGVTPQSTAEEVKKAYRAKAFSLHPDRNPGDAGAADRFKTVQEAYDTLSDPNSRARYDLMMAKPRAIPPNPPRKSKTDEAMHKAWQAEMERGFIVSDAPPPRLDIWGLPIRTSNSRNVRPQFVDVFAGTYESEAVPDIR